MAITIRPLTLAESNKHLRRGIMLEDGRVMVYLPLKLLQVDHKYQRLEVGSTVDRIFDDDTYDQTAIGTFQVSQRRGTGIFYVTDGQCRRGGLLKRLEHGKKVPEYVLCIVRLNSTEADEARDFYNHNNGVPPTPKDKFYSRLKFKGQPEFLINQMVQDKGFALDFFRKRGKPTINNTEPNGIRGVGNILLRAYNDCPSPKGQPHPISLALDFLNAVYGNPESVPLDLRHGAVLYGLALHFYNHHNKNVAYHVRKFKSAGFYDMVAKWKECKKLDPTKYMQHNQSQVFAKWLSNIVNGDSDDPTMPVPTAKGTRRGNKTVITNVVNNN